MVLKNAQLKERSAFPEGTAKKHSKQYHQSQRLMKDEILRSWNLGFCNVFVYTLERYNHLFYWIFVSRCHRKKNHVKLLKPQKSFYILTWMISIFIFWVLSLTLMSVFLSDDFGLAFVQIILVTLIGSPVSCAMIWCFNYFYTKNIYAAFERATAEKDPQVEKLGEMSNWCLNYDHSLQNMPLAMS
jgi:hypothetical protein